MLLLSTCFDFCTGILEVIIFIFPNDQLKEFGVLTVSTCLLLCFVVVLLWLYWYMYVCMLFFVFLIGMVLSCSLVLIS